MDCFNAHSVLCDSEQGAILNDANLALTEVEGGGKIRLTNYFIYAKTSRLQ